MNISTFLSAQYPSASGFGKNTTININTPQDSNGRKRYRQLYYLHFTVDPSSDGIVIDTAVSILQGYFHDYTLHLTANNLSFQTQAWQAITETGNTLPNLVKVHLTHPWHLQSVSTVDHRGVEVLRLDGDVVSSEPTISGNANTTFADKFIGQDFALRKVAAFPIPKPIKKTADKKQQTLAKKSGNDFAVEMASNLGEKGIDSANENLMAASYGIRTINLKSLPTGPRILLGEIDQIPTPEDNLLSIWQQAGEQTQLPVHFFTDNNAWQAALQQIQKACDRYFATLQQSNTPPSAHLYLPIVFESDTPASLQLNELKLEYGLLRQRLDNIKAKHTLKFTGTAIENLQLPLSLPPNSNIKYATLKLKNSLKKGFGLADATALTDTLDLHTGVDMIEGLTVANRVHNTLPQQVDGIVLAILPLADDITATLQIVQDVNNGPNGSILAQTQIKLQQPHVRQWAVAKFSVATLLDTGDYWLCLTIQQGHLFWLGKNGDGAVHIQQKDKVDKKVKLLILQHQFGFSNALNSDSVDVTVRVADTPASLLKKLNSELTFDLASGLNKHYGAGNPAPMLVNLASASKGNITINAVEVIYEIKAA